MKRHWMPLYIGDYLADTAGLSPTEHGVYFLLMMNYWKRGPLPAKHEQCYSIACARDVQDQVAVDKVLSNFFDKVRTKYRHRRIDEEIEKAEKSYKKRADAAKKRWAK